MTELMYALFEYTRDKEVPKYLLDQEYTQAVQVVKKRREKLCAEDPSHFREIEDLLDEVDLGQSFELEAMFQATLALASELLRLRQA